MGYSTYELKYCERCGGLGLRRSNLGLPYCFACEEMMRRFLLRPPSSPAGAGRRSRRTVRLRERAPAKPCAPVSSQESVYAG